MYETLLSCSSFGRVLIYLTGKKERMVTLAPEREEASSLEKPVVTYQLSDIKFGVERDLISCFFNLVFLVCRKITLHLATKVFEVKMDIVKLYQLI